MLALNGISPSVTAPARGGQSFPKSGERWASRDHSEWPFLSALRPLGGGISELATGVGAGGGEGLMRRQTNGAARQQPDRMSASLEPSAPPWAACKMGLSSQQEV